MGAVIPELLGLFCLPDLTDGTDGLVDLNIFMSRLLVQSDQALSHVKLILVQQIIELSH